MIEQVGVAVKFFAFFVAAKVGKAGLADVTVDVYNPAGAQIVTGAAATGLGNGLYYYVLASGSVTVEGEYAAIFKTADGTVDAQHVPSLWVVGRAGVEHLDLDVSAVSAAAGVPVPYAPTSMTRIVGDDEGGTFADLEAHDEVYAQTGEVVGAGLEWIFTRATSTITQHPAVCRITGYYNGGATHVVYIQAYNFTTAAYETKGTMLSRATSFDYVISLTSDNHDPATGEMRTRLLHSTTTYNSGHYVRVDYVSWEKVEGNNQLAADVAAALAILQTYVDATVSSRLAAADFTQRSEPPTAAAVADQVWDEVLSGHVAAGSAGERQGYLDATVSSRLAAADFTQRSEPPTAAAVADQVWDESLSGHSVSGSAGAALGAAGLSADPLLNHVPGAYAAGTAGYALGRIGGGQITVTQPVAQNGASLSLVRGDDYKGDDGRALVFSSASWPDLTDASDVRLTVRRRPEAFGGEGADDVWAAVTDIEASRSFGTPTQTVAFELSAADTASLVPATEKTAAGKFDVQATVDGRIITLVVGRVNVVEDQTR